MTRKPADFGEPEDGDAMNLAATLEERYAFLIGQVASFDLVMKALPASPERLRQLHQLRVAAKVDPSAAYTMGKLLNERYDLTGRKRTLAAALTLYELGAANGLERMRDADEPFADAPRKKRGLRDIVSRSLTNIGAEISNAGYPERATSYFQQAVQVFPENANAHVCLGRMGIFHASETGLDVLDGVRSWERATKLKDYCHESADGCPCRVHFVGTAQQVERDYGLDAARGWVIRAGKAMSLQKKRMASFGPVAASASDVARVAPEPLRRDWASEDCAELTGAVGSFFSEFADARLEVKVTIAATLLMSLVHASSQGRRLDAGPIGKAREALGQIQPLHPFLGDDEWLDLGPPETSYLARSESEEAVLTLVEMFHDENIDLINRLPLLSLGCAVLFHLDTGFRGGVVAIVEGTAGSNEDLGVYLPGLVVGSPPSAGAH